MKTANNYNEFMKALGGKGDTYVFRGQCRKEYVLIPSGLRGTNIKKADEKMFKFVDEMKNLFAFDELTCIEIAQHFFLPTRMLDFTYSFDVALFFACYGKNGSHMDEDGKVFIFNKTRYENILKERNKLSSQVIRNNKLLYEWLEKYIDRKTSNIGNMNIDMPIFVDATREFDRLYMQKGLFLLWGVDESSLEEIFKKEDINITDLVEEIIIPSKSKVKILEELKNKNISEDTLYMNVAKIKELIADLKRE